MATTCLCDPRYAQYNHSGIKIDIGTSIKLDIDIEYNTDIEGELQQKRGLHGIRHFPAGNQAKKGKYSSSPQIHNFVPAAICENLLASQPIPALEKFIFAYSSMSAISNLSGHTLLKKLRKAISSASKNNIFKLFSATFSYYYGAVKYK